LENKLFFLSIMGGLNIIRKIENNIKKLSKINYQTNSPATNSILPKVAVSFFVGQFCGFINFSASYESLCLNSPSSQSPKSLVFTHLPKGKKTFRIMRKKLFFENYFRHRYALKTMAILKAQ